MIAAMTHHSAMPPIEWARRVNRSWLVRSNLNDHSEAWLDYLAGLNDGRLQRSCEMARSLCNLRGTYDDPKPWFYAGLFCLATAAEAKRFLDVHRVTKAAVPAMEHDEAVNLWRDRIRPETAELLERLKRGIRELMGEVPSHQ